MKKKKFDLLFVGIIAFFTVTGVLAATYLYQANEVTYSGDLTSNNVQDAIDELYTKCEASTTTCPSGMTCTAKTNIKCQRATTLHTESCTNSDTLNYCQRAGHALNETITYGNQTTISGVLTVGDAFDCDVDGTGYNHRFYYISDYYDTSTKEFNDKVAVLVYYSNTDDGIASITNVSYAIQVDAQAVGRCTSSYGCNWYGPVTAIRDLPTTTQWSNIRLYKDTRQILAQNNDTATDGGTLPTAFDYSGYAARLLTYQEIDHSCYDYRTKITSEKGLETKCEFLFERTNYANSSYETYGGWTESPYASSTYYGSSWTANDRYVYYYTANSTRYGARPAIEVLKSEILY